MKHKKATDAMSLKDNIAGKIAGHIVGHQLRISRMLSKWERKRSLAQKKLLLLLFVGLAGGYCTYLLADALTRPGNVTPDFRTTPLPADSLQGESVIPYHRDEPV